jgi:hypothetical protein
VTQLAGGAKAGATQNVRIGLVKDSCIVGYSQNTAFAVSLNNVIKVTSPAAVAGYDGWIPLVGSVIGTQYPQVDPRAPIAFGTDWTEPTAGARFLTTFGSSCNAYGTSAGVGTNTFSGGMVAISKGDVQAVLAYNTTYRFYPAYDGTFVRFFGGAQPNSPVDPAKTQLIYADIATALSGSSGVTGITPSAAGGTGSGGGGGCPKSDHRIFAERGDVAGTPYKNKHWVLVRTENGGVFQVVPRHRFTTLRGLIRAQELNKEETGIDVIKTKVRSTGKYEWSKVISAEPIVEEAEAMGVLVSQEDRLYFCGAPDSTCDAESHNLKL